MELMPEFRLHRPTTVEDAVKLRAGDENSRYLAGGTDMLVNIRRGIEAPTTLVDLSAIDGFAEIRADGDGLHIGAGVTLAALGAHDAVGRDYRAVAEAARAVAGPTHQEYGTIGGNLCLDTRCLFYNQSEWWRASNDYCFKYRGTVCHVAPSGQRCFAAFSGDVAPAMLVHDAEIELVGAGGMRRIPLSGLYRNDGRDHLTLEANELLSVIHLPKSTAGLPSSYTKARVRGSIDFPLAGAAVALRIDNGKVAELKVALTAVNPIPQLLKRLDGFIGEPLDAVALDRLRDTARSQAKPMKTTTVKPYYRRRVVGALARRLALRLAEG
jgi:4-hydroxybenzoyl-CoA reductase subunit beta